jgi:hypothetical protein
MMVDVNKQWMIDNQTYVKHILQLAGEENLVDVETDSSYTLYLSSLEPAQHH